MTELDQLLAQLEALAKTPCQDPACECIHDLGGTKRMLLALRVAVQELEALEWAEPVVLRHYTAKPSLLAILVALRGGK
jgi:hypothetical protein